MIENVFTILLTIMKQDEKQRETNFIRANLKHFRILIKKTTRVNVKTKNSYTLLMKRTRFEFCTAVCFSLYH